MLFWRTEKLQRLFDRHRRLYRFSINTAILSVLYLLQGTRQYKYLNSEVYYPG